MTKFLKTRLADPSTGSNCTEWSFFGYLLKSEDWTRMMTAHWSTILCQPLSIPNNRQGHLWLPGWSLQTTQWRRGGIGGGWLGPQASTKEVWSLESWEGDWSVIPEEEMPSNQRMLRSTQDSTKPVYLNQLLLMNNPPNNQVMKTTFTWRSTSQMYCFFFPL